jgi:hypothetical protein
MAAYPLKAVAVWSDSSADWASMLTQRHQNVYIFISIRIKTNKSRIKRGRPFSIPPH